MLPRRGGLRTSGSCREREEAAGADRVDAGEGARGAAAWERLAHVDSLREFFDKELGNLPLSVAMCEHMMRADGTLGSVDELVARFRCIRLEDQEGQNPQTSHPHYFGLVLSVLSAVERMQGSGAHAQADKANAVHLLAMLSVLPGSATPVALFGGSDSGLFGCDEECVDRARAMLVQFGLLRPASEEDVHVGTVHQLVQRCVEQHLRTTRRFDSPEEAKRTLRTLVARLSELAVRWGVHSCMYTRVDDQVAPCVASILDHWSTVAVATGPLHFATKADLEVRLSRFHAERSFDFRLAIKHARSALDSAEALHGLGVDHHHIAVTLHTLVTSLLHNGDFK
jgi:hypothetical protein